MKRLDAKSDDMSVDAKSHDISIDFFEKIDLEALRSAINVVSKGNNVDLQITGFNVRELPENRVPVIIEAGASHQLDGPCPIQDEWL